MKKSKVLIQGESNNSLKKGSRLYFWTERPLSVDNEVVFTNHSGTMKTTGQIVDNSNQLYQAIITTNDPIEDRLDLTHIE